MNKHHPILRTAALFLMLTLIAGARFPISISAEETTAQSAASPAANDTTTTANAAEASTDLTSETSMTTTTTTATTTATTTTTTTPEPISKISYSDGGDGITIDAYRWTDEMTVTIPDQINGRPVTKIAPDAFRYCYADEVLLPDTITEIGADAFKGCRYLKKIVIPKGCLLIGRGAFQDCTQLDTVEFPETAPEIEPSAFDRTAYITRLTDTLVIIGNGLLYAYHGTAAEVTLPDTVRQINANAFANHTELTAITIPESVTRIDTNAFLGCTALSSITLLGTPERIAKDAFTDTAWARDSKEDLLVLGATVLSYRGNQTVPEIPDGVTAIASGAFSDHPGVTTIKLPDSVRKIQPDAFRGCTSLQVVTMGDQMEEIGDRAFYGCTTLSYLRLGHALHTVGTEAFTGCNALTEIYLPDTLMTIGADAIGWKLEPETNQRVKNDALTMYCNSKPAISYAETLGIRREALPDAENTKPAPEVTEQPKYKFGSFLFSDPAYRAGLIGTGLSSLLVLSALIFRKKRKG